MQYAIFYKSFRDVGFYFFVAKYTMADCIIFNALIINPMAIKMHPENIPIISDITAGQTPNGASPIIMAYVFLGQRKLKYRFRNIRIRQYPSALFTNILIIVIIPRTIDTLFHF